MFTKTQSIGRSARGFVQLLEVLALCALSSACDTSANPHPSIRWLGGGSDFGVNIHFTKQTPGELDMIRRAGFRWVRMDFHWGSIECEKGKYDFSAYDELANDLEKAGLKALFILDYGNSLYDGGLSPYTDEGRAAFAGWAAASVKRFAGRGHIWEMWNEPNIRFWKPTPNVTNYIALALATGKAIREAAPREAYVGPALSKIDMPFLESCFRAGLLNYWDAVSVHPYREEPPATMTNDYAELRALIARFAPPGRAIPIIASEWGYSAAWTNYSETIQAEMLTQEFTLSRNEKIPLTIWYDWHDDGTDPKEPEHRFGLVRYAETGNPQQPFEPKPAYEAARQFLNNAQ
jgi:polysaccharide biosynthesis protein PslG